MTKHRLSATLRVGELELRMVESLRVEGYEGAGAWLSASRAPVAVLVKERGATRAYDVDGGPISAEALRQRLPRELWTAAGIEPRDVGRS